MARADDIWAQAWSEPEAGSDLAALRSTAPARRRRLAAQRAEDVEFPRELRRLGLRPVPHRPGRRSGTRASPTSCSTCASKGVTVRPIDQLDGEPGFAEIFLDDVFVPDDPANPGESGVIGGVNEGWRVAMSTASNERGLSLRSPGRFLRRPPTGWSSCGATAGAPTTPRLRDRVADAWIGARAYQLHTFGTVTRLADGGQLGAESSINKVFWSELDIATARDRARPAGRLRPSSRDNWMDGYLFSLSGPIYAGTNEIQKNVIAERLLGLPKADR